MTSLKDQPLGNTNPAGALWALIAVAVGGGYALRPVGRRMRSLRHLAVAITMTSLTVGAITAFVLVRLMVLDAGEVWVGGDCRTAIRGELDC